MAFQGFPAEALAFYEGLEADNSKAYWTAHRATYDRCVKGAMEDLVEAVSEEYRPLRLFRPNRDIRFSKDKSPYKTQCPAAGESEGGAVYYVALSAAGLFAGSGYYHLAPDQLGRFREAVDDDTTGADLVARLAAVSAQRYDLASHEELKTMPRGYAKDHPRAALLRRKGLVVCRGPERGKWLQSRTAVDRVEEVWRAAGPVNEWLNAYVGPSRLPPREAR